MLCSVDALATGYGGADKQDKKNRGSHDNNSFAHSRHRPQAPLAAGQIAHGRIRGGVAVIISGIPFERCLKSGT